MTVYVVTNPIYEKHNVYKIGFSTQTEDALVRRYSTDFGRIILKYNTGYDDHRQAEKDIHRALVQYRIWPNRELFKCPWFVINYELARMDGRYMARSAIGKWWLRARVGVVKKFTRDKFPQSVVTRGR